MDAHIDLSLAYNPTQDARVKATPLLEERMICIGKKEIIGDTSAPISVKSLLGLPFVLLRRGTMGRSVMDDPRLQKQFEQHARLQTDNRSEERRVGKECVSTCRSRWRPYN